MRPCTLRIASAEDDIKATSLNDVLVEHAPWCMTAPNALLIHIKPLDAGAAGVQAARLASGTRAVCLAERALELGKEPQHATTLEISVKNTHEPVFLRHPGAETCHSKGHK